MLGDVASLAEELRVAAGQEPADLYIKNIQIVDVYTETIFSGSLVIKNGKIVAVNPGWEVEAKEVFDGKGRFAVPGFMDAHIHIEPTLLSPEALASVIVPWGTTTLFADPMEIANVAGLKGVEALLNNTENLPYQIYIEVPSRVPTAPGLETTGGVLGVKEVDQLLQSNISASLGELDPSKILSIKEEYLAKIVSARANGKVANGHAIGLNWDQLNVYATAGLSDDHESVVFQELFERLRLGIKALVREGSTERNVEALVKGAIEQNLSTENLIFCTDDKHVNDIVREGHISFNVQKAIALGLNPIKAIQMATINTAKHFRLDHYLGALTPGKVADIVLLDDLVEIKPAYVFKNGKLVAQGGKLTQQIEISQYPAFLNETVKLPPNLAPTSFALPSQGNRCKVNVINLYPDQIINFASQEWLNVAGGEVQVNTNEDILKLAVVERYGKNGSVGVGFVRGFKLKAGALASSVSHDHHNIVIVGTNDQDMDLAAREIARHQGGLVAVENGQVIGVLPLPIGGLMSSLPAEQVMSQIDQLNKKAEQLGCDLPAPFMTLSFISLPTVPELGLTDCGLIHVLEHRIIPTVVETE
ncbi:Adenine deaminase [Desulforamulus reducens MI-1]|uniref:Adenine deaminase n=1 Tax=Desulforamulus reducens (strain ATCC BAA-1160 / DSM 100696 / MI-1) TaxID=349161 RepID=ADEC_DESRM|nr:adenine deaminase [Desulforamulus reducens]A4J872.1 RecName: Full=Adenine deaminase; Short=Adenase; Short=Adenine aminase [Desulforamulus reducens MI-1]ABO51275.1 Adenine deaminase [Desulforamulus reducens MI-1]